MRTFHVGGTATASTEANALTFDHQVIVGEISHNYVTRESDGRQVFPRKGSLKIYRVLIELTGMFDSLVEQETKVEEGRLVLSPVAKGSEIYVKDGVVCTSAFNGFITSLDGRTFIVAKAVENRVAAGSELCVSDYQIVESGKPLVEFDPFSEPIIAEHSGKVLFADIKEGSTLINEVNEETGNIERKITEHNLESLQPRIVIEGEDGAQYTYLLPGGAYLQVAEMDHVGIGSVLAKLSKASQKTKDITGGLPRVGELFEARMPKDPAVLAQVSGTVHIGAVVKSKRIIEIEDAFGRRYKHSVPLSSNLLVRDDEVVQAAEPLCDGSKDPHDILNILGENALQTFLVDEVQQVYRMQGVDINDKHLGIIIRQMLRKVQIVQVGDTNFIYQQQVDKFKFFAENERVMAMGGQPAVARPLLLGITRASLSIDSFISAASFQETTKVLTNAAIAGSKDELRGLKENVIIGHLIPAGTGMKRYRNIQLDAEQLEELNRQVERIRAERKAAQIEEDEDLDIEEIGGMKSVGDFQDDVIEDIGSSDED